MIVRVRNKHTAHVGTLPPGALGLVEETYLAGKLGRYLERAEAPEQTPPSPPVAVEAPPAVEPDAEPEQAPSPAPKRRKGGGE